MPAGGGRIVDQCTAGGADGVTLDTWPANSLRLITLMGSVSADKALPAGQWAHVAAVIAPGQELRLYVNGKQAATAPATAQPGPGGGLIAPDELRQAVSKARAYVDAAGPEKADEYGPAHARLFLKAVEALVHRSLLAIDPPPYTDGKRAANLEYLKTAQRLWEGLQPVLNAAAPGSSAPAAVQ